MKTITMNVHEFMEVQRGNITYKDILKDKKHMKELDKTAGLILSNPLLKEIVLTLIATASIEIQAHAEEIEAIQQVKTQLYSLQSSICPLLIIIIGALSSICCLFDILKGVVGHGSNDNLSLIIKYLVSFSVAAAVPVSFKIISTIFGY